MCGAHPMIYLFGFPALRPFGLPSHSDCSDGAGLAGLPALGGLKWASLPISPLNSPPARREEVTQTDKPSDEHGASTSL